MPQAIRPTLPARSSSLPPIHLSCDQGGVSSISSIDPLNFVSVTKNDDGSFPWGRLPKELQQDILRHALLPAKLGTSALVIGKPSHHAHMLSTAIPILLGQGSWEAYTAAAHILYSEAHLKLFSYPDAAMHFLTSPTTLRIRSLVSKLQIRMDIEHDLYLFDEGWRSKESAPEARVNIPTALYGMHNFGRLHEVHFMLNVPEIIYYRDADPVTMKECTVPSYYLPLARVQLAHREKQGWDVAGFYSTPTLLPGREVIAPTFLAARAWQYGFLPLLKGGAIGKSSFSLEVVSKDGKSRVEESDAEAVFRCWLGATILEVLTKQQAMNTARGKWVDPFAIARRVNNRGQTPMLQQVDAYGGKSPTVLTVDDDVDYEMANANMREPDAQRDRTDILIRPERIGYKSRGDDLLVSSPIRYDSSSPPSVAPTEDVKMDLASYCAVTAAKDEASRQCEVNQACDRNNPSQSEDSGGKPDLFSSCLETAFPQAVSCEVVKSMERPWTGRKASTSPLPCNEDGSNSDSSHEHGGPLELIGRLDCDKPAVIETIGPEKATSPGQASFGEKKSNPTPNTIQDESPQCHSTTLKIRTSGSIALMRDHDGSSMRDNDVHSRCSPAKEDKDHCNKSTLISEIFGSWITRHGSSSDSASDSDSDSDSSSSDEDDDAFNKSTIIAGIFGSSMNRRGESNKAGTKCAVCRGMEYAVPHDHAAAALPSEKARRRGGATSKALSSNISPIAFRPVTQGISSISNATQTNPAAHKKAQGPATAGQKRKASLDEPELGKMSRNARRRANRRARLSTRTTEDE